MIDEKIDSSVKLRKLDEEMLSKLNLNEEISPQLKIKMLLNEVHKHQMEIKMLNEELLSKQLDLNNTKQKYYNLFEFAPVGYVTLNEDGKVINSNKMASSLFGLEISKMQNKYFFDFIAFNDQNKFFNFQKSLILNDKPKQLEIQFMKNGLKFWRLLDAVLVRSIKDDILMQITIRDINKRKKAENDLRESEQKWRFMIDSEPECITMLDCNCKVLEMNKAGLEMIHAKSSHVIGKSAVASVAVEDQNAFKEMVEAVFRGETRHLIYDMFVSKGKRLHLETTCGPLKDTDEEVRALLSITRDITERKRTEDEIQKLVLDLQDLNSSKDKFLSIIAHDLRSPFQGFLGMTEIMAEEISDFSKEELKEFAISINHLAQNVFTLLNNLLEWAQLQHGSMSYDPQKLSLNNMISNIVEITSKRSSQKEIEIINNVIEQFDVYVDYDMISSLLLNLLCNAVKFTHKGGTVTIAASRTKGNMVEISISDTGIGMKQDLVDNLFKIGKSVGSKGTDGELSTGLGLLLCKEFIEKHGGKIWVESELGIGSKFVFTLRLVK